MMVVYKLITNYGLEKFQDLIKRITILSKISNIFNVVMDLKILDNYDTNLNHFLRRPYKIIDKVFVDEKVKSI